MIILGEKYTFSDFEMRLLEKRFSHVVREPYMEESLDEMSDRLEPYLSTSFHRLIVYNIHCTDVEHINRLQTRLKCRDLSDPPQVMRVEQFLEKYLQKCYIPENYSEADILKDIKPFTKWQYFQKRLIDYFGVFWLFFFSWPVLLYCRQRIKKESMGTSMFKQHRIGLGNREFKCIKFRSMRLDAEADGAKFASENDPRTFRWGEIMRKTRFDELPQMLNILKSEMHLIGPRPERKIWIEEFEKIIPHYSKRHFVRPGVTGWAQVMYPYGANAEDARQKLMYDLYYIKYWSMALELKIVWMTALTVIRKKGI
ncbi:sugar transferase [Sulfuricurvum sp. RIFCSPLOWO2_12_FULL_43_24]|uniref:sugar transferase n=1 Tax=Sulfuricurvum sp. RIFCSPLOWO2_12_FULL_43_24 TaxID=1802247 RepID=UPI0008D424A2|nr:sugar transferase [Sulfuricurvum sp. RIFCSPLOWO2_12_FULL_43_24]OHD90700.1 MAG: hypothetical protein A3G19_04125 [Sulfuricurvum sp. RIFCSPLOWO2_12_FULL_43_24]